MNLAVDRFVPILVALLLSNTVVISWATTPEPTSESSNRTLPGTSWLCIGPAAGDRGRIAFFEEVVLLDVAGEERVWALPRYNERRTIAREVAALGRENRGFEAEIVDGELELRRRGATIRCRKRIPQFASESEAPESPLEAVAEIFVPGEIWSGSYTCAQGSTRAALQIDELLGGALVLGTFHFTHEPTNVSGSFRVVGHYAPQTGTVDWRAREWVVQPKNYVTVDFDGEVLSGGREMTGTVNGPGCTVFILAR